MPTIPTPELDYLMPERSDTLRFHMLKGRSAPADWPDTLGGEALQYHPTTAIRMQKPPPPRTCWQRLDTLKFA